MVGSQRVEVLALNWDFVLGGVVEDGIGLDCGTECLCFGGKGGFCVLIRLGCFFCRVVLVGRWCFGDLGAWSWVSFGWNWIRWDRGMG